MENEKEESIFKVPKLFIGPRPGTKKIVKCIETKSYNDSEDDAPTTNTKVTVQGKPEQPIQIVKKTSQVPIPYEEPSWGGKPSDKYFLEV